MAKFPWGNKNGQAKQPPMRSLKSLKCTAQRSKHNFLFLILFMLCNVIMCDLVSNDIKIVFPASVL